MWYKLAFKCFCLYVECRFYSWKTGLYAKFFHVLYKLGEWCVENSEEDYARRPTLIEQTIEAWERYRKLRSGSLEFRALAETSYAEMKKSFCLSLISKESSRKFLGLFFCRHIFYLLYEVETTLTRKDRK